MEEEGIMTTIQVCRLRFRSRQARAAVWRWSKGGKEEEEEEEKEEEERRRRKVYSKLTQ